MTLDFENRKDLYCELIGKEVNSNLPSQLRKGMTFI